VIISFFALAIFFFSVSLFWNGIVDLNDDLWDQSSVGSTIKDNAQNAVDTFDYILLMVYIGLHLGVLALAFLLRTHPVVYVASIILVALLALVAAPLSNAYEDLKDNEDIITVSVDYPITNFILEQLPKFEVIWGFITAIVLFGLARNEGFV